MSLGTRSFDPAAYLDSAEARAAYLAEALETGDPIFIADSLHAVARAVDMHRAASEPIA
jgi:probable addiction module antidote protein